MNPAMTGYLWCALAALASALATFLIKLSNGHGVDWNLARIAFLGGAATTYGLGFVCYSVALQKLDINTAYPVMTAFAMAMVAILSVTALNETMTLSKVIGMILVALGALAIVR